MSANTPQTKEQILVTKDRSRFRITLALIILGALAFSIVAGWLGLVKPVAAADLSNGAFCIAATYDSDPEFTGKAGNCKPAAPIEAPATRTDFAMFQQFDFTASTDFYTRVNWADGKTYGFTHDNGFYDDGLPALFESDYGQGDLTCAAEFDLCAIRVEITDTTDGSMIASVTKEGIEGNGTGQDGGVDFFDIFTSKLTNSSRFADGGVYLKTFEGRLVDIEEIKSSANLPEFYPGDTLNYKVDIYASKDGVEVPMGTLSGTMTADQCAVKEDLADWNGTRTVQLWSSCTIDL